MLLELVLATLMSQLKFESNLVTSRLSSQCVRVQEREVFEKRLPTARKIEIELRKRGLHRDKTILALLVNTWHETRWNPTLNSDGIFQMTPTGMGKGMTTAQKQDIPTTVHAMVNTPRFQTWWEYSKNPKVSTADSAYKFADYVLRPKKQYRLPRKYTAQNWEKFLKPKPYKN